MNHALSTSNSDEFGNRALELISSVRDNVDNYYEHMIRESLKQIEEAQIYSVDTYCPEATSNMHPYESDQVKDSRKVSEFDLNQAIPPLIDFPEKSSEPVRTLQPIAEWEGYIDQITEDEFSVKMIDVRSKSALPIDQAFFH